MKGLSEVVDTWVVAASQAGARGTAQQLRRFLQGVVWILRTGAPWRDLPPHFGAWNLVFRRFRRWALSGRWDRVRAAPPSVETSACVLIDSTSIKAHPDSAGARGRDASAEGLGRSRGGFTTKLHALVSSDGRLLASCLMPGQHADIRFAIPLLERIVGPTRVVAVRAYDSDALLAWLQDAGVEAIIPARRNRRVPRALEFTWLRSASPRCALRQQAGSACEISAYTMRNVIERFFGRLKRFRRVGTRYDKTASSFGAFVGLGAAAVERTSWA